MEQKLGSEETNETLITDIIWQTLGGQLNKSESVDKGIYVSHTKEDKNGLWKTRTVKTRQNSFDQIMKEAITKQNKEEEDYLLGPARGHNRRNENPGRLLH